MNDNRIMGVVVKLVCKPSITFVKCLTFLARAVARLGLLEITFFYFVSGLS